MLRIERQQRASAVGEDSPLAEYGAPAGAARPELAWIAAALALITLSVIAYWRRVMWAAILLRIEALTLLTAGVLEKRGHAAAPHAVVVRPAAAARKRLLGPRTRWLLKKEIAIPRKLLWK